MNPKRAPAMSTVPIHVIPEQKTHSKDIVNVLKSIKQTEQMQSYVRDLESKLAQATKSSL